MRLRVYVPGLLVLVALALLNGGGAVWWLGLCLWFLLHYAAYRAVHVCRYAHELGLLREIYHRDSTPATSLYRRERSDEAEIANPLPDLEADFGERVIAHADPSHHMRKRHLRRWLGDFARPGRLAGDVGCLAGEVSAEHVAAGHRVFLFDLDLVSLTRAAETTGRPAAQADASRLPVMPGVFDVATLLEVIEHVADPLVAFGEVASALAPRGLLLASTDNAGALLPFHLLNPLIILEKLAGLFWPRLLPPRSLVKDDHVYGKVYPHASFDSRAIRMLAEEAGLSVVWLKSYYFLPGFHRLVAKLFPRCTEEDYVRWVLPMELFLQRLPVISRLGTHWLMMCERPGSGESSG